MEKESVKRYVMKTMGKQVLYTVDVTQKVVTLGYQATEEEICDVISWLEREAYEIDENFQAVTTQEKTEDEKKEDMGIYT